jgi:teichuronic acid exporter
MITLKQKTLTGLSWSFIDNIAVYGIQFIFGIILARFLSPVEYGLIGMLTIFIAISFSFIDSGFSQAIIRKQKATQIDYSTVFYFNIIVSLIFYFVLFFSANTISSFFDEPILEIILKILGIGLIIDSLSIIQRARLTKQINFKLQTKISVIASISSGIIGIILAFKGFGVWSLVVKMLTRQAFTTTFLWIWNEWKPSFVFSIKSFKEMFAFGSNLLFSGLIDTIYRNIYLLIIGKYFSATELGYYTRADQFKNLPSKNLSAVINRVSYPVLATIQNDKEQLKAACKRLIKSTMFITFILMIGLAAIAKPMVLTLIGEKWLPSVIYIQLLCIAGMLYPMHIINLNILKVIGRSDLFLKLEVIKKLLAIPIIFIGISFGIQAMIIAMFFNSLIGYFINSYYTGKFIGYSSIQQLRDIYSSFIISLLLGGIIFLEGHLLKIHFSIIFIIQIFTGIILFFVLVEATKLNDYIYLKNIVLKKIKKS